MKTKKLIAMGILVALIAFMNACKSETSSFSDPALYGYWRLDSIGTITSSSYFKDTNSHGDLLIHSFGNDGKATSFVYGGGISGSGSYSYFQDRKLVISTKRFDKLPIPSPYWVNVYLDVANSATSYKLSGDQLVVYYLSDKLAKFTKP